MENLVNKQFNNIYQGARVFITGHTGFKGSWLAFWLERLGATIAGYSLNPTTPNHVDLLNLKISSTIADIRDRSTLTENIEKFSPDIVFHLAAQPLVRTSYQDPIETFETNILGSMNVCEAVRATPSVKALVMVTTDKVYRNVGSNDPFVETDPLGGDDPYSASKAAMEILVASYRHSFFSRTSNLNSNSCLLGVARAGNVIGGGDWAKDRLIPDIVRGAINETITDIRAPNSTRPWQHVLEPLSGYLLLGQKLLEGKDFCAQAFNFGPAQSSCLPVIEVVEKFRNYWKKVEFRIDASEGGPAEAKLLRLNIEKAENELNWQPLWDVERAINKTSSWYRDFVEEKAVNTEADLEEYISEAQHKKYVWTI